LRDSKRSGTETIVYYLLLVYCLPLTLDSQHLAVAAAEGEKEKSIAENLTQNTIISLPVAEIPISLMKELRKSR
jgi:hypothetical protein